MDENKALREENRALQISGEKVNVRVENERKRTDEAVSQAMEIKKEVDLKVSKAIEDWRASLAFDALSQEAYVLAIGEIIKFIKEERSDQDTTFLEDALKE